MAADGGRRSFQVLAGRRNVVPLFGPRSGQLATDGHDPVRRVWVVPQPHATDHLVFRYEYASGLRALGIRPRSSSDRLWERENGDLGFALPPRR